MPTNSWEKYYLKLLQLLVEMDPSSLPTKVLFSQLGCSLTKGLVGTEIAGKKGDSKT